MEFRDLDPLLHNELRLKVMVALDSLDDADFVYLKGLTGASAGNLSVQLTNLQDAVYIKKNRCHVRESSFPATLLKTHPEWYLYIDDDAASLLIR